MSNRLAIILVAAFLFIIGTSAAEVCFSIADGSTTTIISGEKPTVTRGTTTICDGKPTVTGGSTHTSRNCPNNAAAPFLPYQHCGHDFRTPCNGNSADNRYSWCECDICTDPETFCPFTGVTREYDFHINGSFTAGPDGVIRDIVLVNGQLPGPTIFADWGDEVVIRVYNNLVNLNADTSDDEGYDASGLTIHWHGINQKLTNENDGVPSLTQCPVPPGTNKPFTYRWRATHHGTAWYHSHIETQAWNGVFGGIIINGPSSANYDEDRGVLFLNDWSHQSTETYYETISSTGPKEIANGLMNGTNIWNNSNTAPPGTYYGPPIYHLEVAEESTTLQVTTPTDIPTSTPTATPIIGGYRFNMTVERHKKYRLRLVNAAIDTDFEFRIEGHDLTVIANDLVPIVPYTTSVLHIGMGQRYDVIVETNSADPGPFWIRAHDLIGCSSGIFSPNHTKGIMYYDNYTGELPKYATDMTKDTFCLDERLDDLQPYIAHEVPWPWPNLTNAAQFGELQHGGIYESKLFDATVSMRSPDSVMEWQLSGDSMHVVWDQPTLESILQGTTADLSNAVILPGTVKWFYLLLTNGQARGQPAAHPMHLHGHDFYVLSQSSYPWDGTVKIDNPPRRDTALLNSGKGHLLLAWKIDNPGVWLFHCHLGWHTEMGFDIQFIEMPEQIPSIINGTALEENCQEWKTAAAQYAIFQSPNDSGV